MSCVTSASAASSSWWCWGVKETTGRTGHPDGNSSQLPQAHHRRLQQPALRRAPVNAFRKSRTAWACAASPGPRTPQRCPARRRPPASGLPRPAQPMAGSWKMCARRLGNDASSKLSAISSRQEGVRVWNLGKVIESSRVPYHFCLTIQV